MEPNSFIRGDMDKKLMMVEDDSLIRSELQILLVGNGYEVSAPEEFSEIVELVKTEQPQLILLDIKLPYSNGFSLCSQIRTFSDVPIIFVTSCNTDMDELNSIMLGVPLLLQSRITQQSCLQRWLLC